MKYDIVLAGVGGQGVLSVSTVIAAGAMAEGLHVKQSEVHGMAQRGGAVLAHLRLSDRPVASELIPRATASLILSMEPLESLRYLDLLGPEGSVISASSPVRNIDDYPPLEEILARVSAIPHAQLVDAERLARQAGSPRAVNMVLVGAASSVLPLRVDTLEQAIATRFGAKGEGVVQLNVRAFRLGREAVEPAPAMAGAIGRR